MSQDTHQKRLDLFVQLKAGLELLRDSNASSGAALQSQEASRVLRLATLQARSTRGLPTRADPDSLRGAPSSLSDLRKLREQLAQARAQLAASPQSFGIEPPEA